MSTSQWPRSRKVLSSIENGDGTAAVALTLTLTRRYRYRHPKNPFISILAGDMLARREGRQVILDHLPRHGDVVEPPAAEGALDGDDLVA